MFFCFGRKQYVLSRIGLLAMPRTDRVWASLQSKFFYGTCIVIRTLFFSKLLCMCLDSN